MICVSKKQGLSFDFRRAADIVDQGNNALIGKLYATLQKDNVAAGAAVLKLYEYSHLDDIGLLSAKQRIEKLSHFQKLIMYVVNDQKAYIDLREVATERLGSGDIALQLVIDYDRPATESPYYNAVQNIIRMRVLSDKGDSLA